MSTLLQSFPPQQRSGYQEWAFTCCAHANISKGAANIANLATHLTSWRKTIDILRPPNFIGRSMLQSIHMRIRFGAFTPVLVVIVASAIALAAYAAQASAESATSIEYAEYRNDRWHYSLAVPDDMTVGVYDQAGVWQTCNSSTRSASTIPNLGGAILATLRNVGSYRRAEWRIGPT